MEECEALCNRLVIMVKGQLVCIGASQELKQRFDAGYDIHIKLNPSRTDDDVINIKKIIESSLLCEIRDENLVNYIYMKYLIKFRQYVKIFNFRVFVKYPAKIKNRLEDLIFDLYHMINIIVLYFILLEAIFLIRV